MCSMKNHSYVSNLVNINLVNSVIIIEWKISSFIYILYYKYLKLILKPAQWCYTPHPLLRKIIYALKSGATPHI